MSSAAFAYPQKSAEAFRTISEVSQDLDVPQHVLRFWESRFAQVRPVKRAGGRRYYRPEDVALVETIDRLINREGYTLKGARQAIEKGRAGTSSARPEPVEGQSFATGPSTSSGRTEVEVLPQLRAIRQRLASALAA